MILVTGATGFLGSELCKQLALQEITFKALKRSISPIPNQLHTFTNIHWINGSLLDLQFSENISHDITTIYHCAAMVSFEAHDEEEMMKYNVVGTKNLVNFCLSRNIKLLHVSSVATLDGKNTLKLTDESCFPAVLPQTHNYGLSKYLSELAVLEGMKKGLQAIIINPSIIIGFTSNYVGSGAFFKAVKNGLPFYTYGSAGFVAVEDVAMSMQVLMKKECFGNRYIISAENITYRKFCQMIAAAYGVKAPKIGLNIVSMALIWRVAKFYSILLNSTPFLTKETARSSNNVSCYTSEKLIKTTNIRFQQISAKIQEVVHLYRATEKKSNV